MTIRLKSFLSSNIEHNFCAYKFQVKVGFLFITVPFIRFENAHNTVKKVRKLFPNAHIMFS